MSKAHPALSYSGYCSDCKKNHALPSEKAIEQCHVLIEQLQKHKRIDFETSIDNADQRLSTSHLYTATGGKMFGVLVCTDVSGKEIILRAYSSTHNGVWNVAGWMPHLVNEQLFMKIVEESNLKIHPLTTLISTLKKNSNDWRLKINERKAVSQETLIKLHALYEITNFKKEKRSLTNAFNIKKSIPNGTGDCCAPKLLNYAAQNNLKPVSIAEFYWGKTSASRNRIEKEFYSSCIDKCGPLLGFMLCGSE